MALLNCPAAACSAANWLRRSNHFWLAGTPADVVTQLLKSW
jgi:hypothetical protein